MFLGEEINSMSNNFPKKELYSLASQINRAADSIALNISEGAILQSNAEFKRFLGYSIRSIAEVVTCLYKAKNREYISDDKFEKLYLEGYNLMNQTIAFRNQLKDK